MTTVEVTAYETVEVAGLTASQARLLVATKAVSVTPGWRPKAWILSAGPYIGVLRCEDFELRIRPRITIARLIFLLGYTNDPDVWRDDPAGLDDQLDLWPAMAQIFSRQAERPSACLTFPDCRRLLLAVCNICGGGSLRSRRLSLGSRCR